MNLIRSPGSHRTEAQVLEMYRWVKLCDYASRPVVQIVIIFTWIRAWSFNWTSFCILCLKLAQWFWGRLLNVYIVFLLFCYCLPLRKDVTIYLNKLESHFSQALVDIGCMVRENNFKCCKCIFNIILPRKNACRFICTDYNSHQRRMLWDKFGWNWSSWFWRRFLNVVFVC